MFLLMSLQGAYYSHTKWDYAATHDACNTRAMQHSNSTAQTQELLLVYAVYTDAMVDGIEA